MVILPEPDVETLDILYVADDQTLAEMYRLKLELDGYWVRVVDLDNAVAETRARRPDIIFLELPAGRPDRLGILEDLRHAAPARPAGHHSRRSAQPGAQEPGRDLICLRLRRQDFIARFGPAEQGRGPRHHLTDTDPP